MTVGNTITAYKYNKNDELLRTDTLNTETEEDSVVIYKYDKNGNQLATVNRYEIPSDKKDETYVDIDVTLGDNRLNGNVVNHYNALNQLTQTFTKNYKVSFTYDAEGLRTSKTVNGEKTVYVWDGDQLVMELSEGGKVQKRYIRGNNLVYADKGTGTEKQYYVTDPHGNVVQLTDEDGAVIKTYEYDSFGNEVNPDKKDDNPLRYCGEYYDKEVGEVYLRARYYQPVAGRFLTRDTYTGEEDESLSLHLYTYCGNDGVNAWDPSGHIWTKWKEKEIQIKGKKNVQLTSTGRELRICTDGKNKGKLTEKNSKPYGDLSHKKHTACFSVTPKKGDKKTKEDDISADEIPYIVVPVKLKKKYAHSLGVIINPVKKEYLYCVVAESGPNDNGMGEVSIYAAWAMKHLLDTRPAIAQESKKNSKNSNKNWKIILYLHSAPRVGDFHDGWPMDDVKLRKKIYSVGKKFYKMKGGKCLNESL